MPGCGTRRAARAMIDRISVPYYSLSPLHSALYSVGAVAGLASDAVDASPRPFFSPIRLIPLPSASISSKMSFMSPMLTLLPVSFARVSQRSSSSSRSGFCTYESISGGRLKLDDYALSGSDDKTVKLFNVNDGAVLRTFKHHRLDVTSLALLPDGLRFVSGSNDNTARIVEHGVALPSSTI